MEMVAALERALKADSPIAQSDSTSRAPAVHTEKHFSEDMYSPAASSTPTWKDQTSQTTTKQPDVLPKWKRPPPAAKSVRKAITPVPNWLIGVYLAVLSSALLVLMLGFQRMSGPALAGVGTPCSYLRNFCCFGIGPNARLPQKESTSTRRCSRFSRRHRQNRWVSVGSCTITGEPWQFPSPQFNIRTTLFESPAGLELRRMVIRARAEGRELTEEEQQRAQEVINADARRLDSEAALDFLQDKLRRSQQVAGQSASITGRVAGLSASITGRLIFTRLLQGHTDSVWSAAFTNDSNSILSGSLDGTVRLWNVATGAVFRGFHGHSEGVTGVAISGDGVHALTGSLDGALTLWDMRIAATLKTLQAHQGKIFAVAFAPDGHHAVSAGEDRTARVWSLIGEEVRRFENHTGWVTCLAVSSDQYYAVSGSEDRTLRVWHSVSGRELLCIEGHTGAVRSVAVSPDGTRILSGSDDGTMRLWDRAAAGSFAASRVTPTGSAASPSRPTAVTPCPAATMKRYAFGKSKPAKKSGGAKGICGPSSRWRSRPTAVTPCPAAMMPRFGCGKLVRDKRPSSFTPTAD